MRRLLLIAACAAFTVSAAAQDPAALGQAMAEAQNKRSVEGMLALLDAPAVSHEAVKDLGLDAKDRATIEGHVRAALRGYVENSIRSQEHSKGSAKFLRAGSRAGRAFALVRYDLGDQGIDYVEFYLAPASGKVQDWYPHSAATSFSRQVQQNLATMLKTDSMMFSLLGVRVTEADSKPFRVLRDALSKQDYPLAYKSLEDFPESYRKSRQWALMRVAYGARTGEENHRAALRHLALNFGADPDLQFMLVDHYFFEKQYDRAIAAVGGLERAIGGDDGATGNLRGNLLIAAQRYDEAEKACRRAIAIEPEYAQGYWCLVTVGLSRKSGKLTLEALLAYEKAFQVVFDPVKLAQQEVYKPIFSTPEMAAWAKSRRK